METFAAGKISSKVLLRGKEESRLCPRSMDMYVPNYLALPIIKRLLGLENVRADRKRRRRRTVWKKRETNKKENEASRTKRIHLAADALLVRRKKF